MSIYRTILAGLVILAAIGAFLQFSAPPGDQAAAPAQKAADSPPATNPTAAPKPAGAQGASSPLAGAPRLPAPARSADDRASPGPKPGPVTGAIVANGEVITIRQWDYTEVPRPSRAKEIAHMASLAKSAQEEMDRMEQEIQEIQERFFLLGGYLDADALPAFDDDETMDEELRSELAEMEEQWLSLLIQQRMKVEQIDDARAQIEDLRHSERDN